GDWLVCADTPSHGADPFTHVIIRGSSGLRRFFRYAMFIYSFYLCYSLSLYPFTERYAQPYFFSRLIRQRGVTEDEGPTWMTQLVDYLKEGILPGDKKEARKIRLKARQYELMEGVLYRRSFLTPWLRCMGPLQADYLMREIHEGSCSMHAGARAVVAKAMRLGYYWLTMHKDAHDMIRKCSDCSVHRPRKVKFFIVAMDYFTKWIEAKAVATITGGQFADNPFKDWCDKLNITQRFASVKHPQSNGLVERANRSLGEGIKARLGEGNTNWVEELSHVLWAHRTMIKSSHGDTPFSLTYRTEAVIPAEIRMPTYRTAAVDVVNNDEELRLNLDLLEERRELTAISEAKSKSKMMKYYNARVRGVAFKPGDFVYRSNDASHTVAVAGGKLRPKWEGPYEVTEALGNGAYKLRSTEGIEPCIFVHGPPHKRVATLVVADSVSSMLIPKTSGNSKDSHGA
nr:reverse transcriptase domain-containing protein [Tanacetum cinerariifolium]